MSVPERPVRSRINPVEFRGPDGFLSHRYVYDKLGGKHENVLEELVATLCTFGVTILWLGPCEVVLLWAFFNCFGLNFELWTAKLSSMEPFASFEVGLGFELQFEY